MVNTRVLGVYAGAYVGSAIVFGLVSSFVVDLPAGGAIAAIIAGLFAGQYFARLHEREPTSQESWVHAVAFLVCIMLISALQILVFVPPIALSWSSALMAIISGYAVIILLANRFFFAKGAQVHMKAHAKQIVAD